MTIDVYGRYQLEIERQGQGWIVSRREEGKRRPDPDIIIPSRMRPEEIIPYLEDILHEYALPGRVIRLVKT